MNNSKLESISQLSIISKIHPQMQKSIFGGASKGSTSGKQSTEKGIVVEDILIG